MNRLKTKVSHMYYRLRWANIPKYQRQTHRLKAAPNPVKGWIVWLYKKLKA